VDGSRKVGNQMILVRSPLRITLGGGGTDLPAYYSRHGGMFLTAAIDKYVYVSVLRPFVPGVIVKHSGASEQCTQIANIKHPLIREALRMYAPSDWKPQIELTTLADVPAGTGLGSSSACACALLRAIRLFFRPQDDITRDELAEEACVLEMDILKEPIGKQDAYASAFGNCTPFMINEQGKVSAQPGIDWRVQERLEQRLQLYFTGFSRSASNLLQLTATGKQNDLLHNISYLGQRMLAALRAGALWQVGGVFSTQWEEKQRRSLGITSERIDNLYAHGLRNGATGGKLVGAGGGGFLLFYTTEPEQLRAGMAELAVEELPFKFEDEGTMVVCQ